MTADGLAGAGREQRRGRLQFVGAAMNVRLIVVVLLIGAAVVVAVFGKQIAPYDPYQLSPLEPLRKPTFAHWFGTDAAGRDIFSGVVVGTRQTLSVAAGSVLFALAAAVPLGLLAGFVGLWFERVVLRLADVLLTVPSMVLALAVVVTFGQSAAVVSAAVGVTLVPLYIRLARGESRRIRSRDFVLAAEASGASPARVVMRHVLPNAMTPIMVQASIDLAYVIHLTAALAFLGFGGASFITWGGQLHDSFRLINRAPWMIIPVSCVLIVLSSAFVALGGALEAHWSRR